VSKAKQPDHEHNAALSENARMWVETIVEWGSTWLPRIAIRLALQSPGGVLKRLALCPLNPAGLRQPAHPGLGVQKGR
jgi:hypothetical protein